MGRYVGVICLVVLLILVSGRHAVLQADEPEQAVRLDEVVVTATRGLEEVRKIPANVSVITAEDIEKSGAVSIVEVLERLESINVRSYTGNPFQAMVDLRGMGGDNPFGKILVMLDGRRMNRPDMASVNWLQVPLATVDRIEVVRGSGSVLYGDSAVAGVINVITKKGEGPPSANGSVMFGSYGLRDERLGVAGSEGKLSYSLSGEHLKTFGYRDRSKFSSKGGAVDLGYEATDRLKLSLGLSYNEMDYELPGTLTKEEMAISRKRAQNLNDESSDSYGNIDFRIEALLGEYGELSMGVAYGRKELETDMPSYWAPNQYNAFEMGTLGLMPKYVLEKPMAGHDNKLTLGVDFYDETLDVEKFADAQRAEQTHAIDFTKRSVGSYMRDEFYILPSLILSGGFRVERTSIKGDYRDFYDPTAAFAENKKIHRGKAWETGLTWLTGDMSNVFIRYGAAYRYPFLDEQASYNFGSEFLMDLEKETSRNYEIGTRLFPWENLRIGVTAYLIDVKNQIAWDDIAFRNRNLDPTRHRGLELNARYEYEKLFMIEGNATFSRSEFREGPYSGNDVPLAPCTASFLALEVYLPGNFVLRPELQYVGDAYLAEDFDNNTEKLEGRTLVNLSLRHNHVSGRLELSAFLCLDNITDEKYSTYGYDNDQWGIPGLANTYYPAPGRTVKGGLSVRF